MEKFSYRELCRRLTPLYDEREARAVARLALESEFGITMEDIVMGADMQLPIEATERLANRLLAGEPVQYVVGRAVFGGRWFSVSPSVLIPRPETAELVEMAAEEARQCRKPCRILDIGTGSGCIAVSLALDVDDSVVTAIDISPDAIAVAQRNADALGAKVEFSCDDILHTAPSVSSFDIIVSNPPYICNSEKQTMEKNVVEYEPRQALFVDDDDAMLFYRAISRYAAVALSDGGSLWFEINERFGSEVVKCIADAGLADAEIMNDEYGKERFVKAWKR
ncbi:MAG: peptide chain release factor N(5)-glutamine methyltransferase [Prevotella sp.]|nr:peptide chain release factor N(5)-glutamine methyltransferase [Prevotella sp.]